MVFADDVTVFTVVLLPLFTFPFGILGLSGVAERLATTRPFVTKSLK